MLPPAAGPATQRVRGVGARGGFDVSYRSEPAAGG